MTQVRFAAARCQHWESGYYTAWRRIAEENLDFVFHYGDYIYEFARSQTAFGNQPAARVMREGFFTCINLLDLPAPLRPLRPMPACPIAELPNQGASAASTAILSEREKEIQSRHTGRDQSVVISIHLARARPLIDKA